MPGCPYSPADGRRDDDEEDDAEGNEEGSTAETADAARRRSGGRIVGFGATGGEGVPWLESGGTCGGGRVGGVKRDFIGRELVVRELRGGVVDNGVFGGLEIVEVDFLAGGDLKGGVGDGFEGAGVGDYLGEVLVGGGLGSHVGELGLPVIFFRLIAWRSFS